MAQEDKELLIKDLCGRLPYGIICDCLHSISGKATIVDVEDMTVYYTDCDEWEPIEHCRPYLRPMDSMTREECNEYGDLCHVEVDTYANIYSYDTIESIDWLNAHHFDYRGLIEKGLALGAPSDMYQ